MMLLPRRKSIWCVLWNYRASSLQNTPKIFVMRIFKVTEYMKSMRSKEFSQMDYRNRSVMVCPLTTAPRKTVQSMIWRDKRHHVQTTSWYIKYQCATTWWKDWNQTCEWWMQRRPCKWYLIEKVVIDDIFRKNPLASRLQPTAIPILHQNHLWPYSCI